MAEVATGPQNEIFAPAKASLCKQAFQWAGAVASVICAEAPQQGFEAAGNAYDYTVTKAKLALNPPKPA